MKDFHTIGGWPVLSSLLADRHAPAVRAAAAWAVGTAVKNSYDYQVRNGPAVRAVYAMLTSFLAVFAGH